MTFGQFISYWKNKILFKNFSETATLKLDPGLYLFAKN